jgi:phosphoglycolate phosphatase-like HAD superfamily hydrolase
MDGVIADTRDVKINAFKQVLHKNGFVLLHSDQELLKASRPSEIFINYSERNLQLLSIEYLTCYERFLLEAKLLLDFREWRVFSIYYKSILYTAQPLNSVIATFQVLFNEPPHKLFDILITEEDLQGLKKSSDQSVETLSLAIKKSNIQPVNIFYIGDSPEDIMCAKKIGATSVAVSWGYFSYKELNQYSPDIFINSNDELTTLIFGKN